MNIPFYGSSLFQARKTNHAHRHAHLHHRQSDKIHAHSHAEFHNRRDEAAELDSRDTITEIIQTYSVVQIIDGTGATISAETVKGSSQTDLLDGETGSTIAVAVKAATTDVGTTAESYSATAVSTADPVSVTSDATISATSVSSSVPAYLSLTHISSSSTFSTLSTASNSTTSSTSSTFLSSVPTLYSSDLPTNTSNSPYASPTGATSLLSSTPVTPVASTTFTSSVLTSPSSLSDSTSAWTTGSSAGWSSSESASGTSTGTAGGDGSTTTGTAGSSPAASTSASSGSSGGGTSPQTKEVVGGVFGGIAGVALLVGLAFLILRLKKRGWCQLRLGGGEDEASSTAPRALPAASGGDGPAGGGGGSAAYGTMQQRSAPQGMAASIAAMAGKRSSRDRAGSGSEMAERGFVRVSGRKLPPVLQYGGDGYTDPRNSQMSEASASVYRDSIAVFDQPNATRLALGSPMRPESGIMTMQPGPAKTPVTTEAPRHIDSPTLPRSSTFPATDALGRTLESEGFSRDAIGRTLAAHDFSRDGATSRASRGSHTSRGSTRFTEHVT